MNIRPCLGRRLAVVLTVILPCAHDPFVPASTVWATESAPIQSIVIQSSGLHTDDDDYSLTVQIDCSLDQGDALSHSDGSVVGSYEFHVYETGDYAGASILTITTVNTADEHPEADVHLFLVDSLRTAFTHFASSGRADYLNCFEIDLTLPHWQLVPGLFDHPLALEPDEYDTIVSGFFAYANYADTWAFNTDIKATFIVAYYRLMLGALSEHPGFTFQEEAKPFRHTATEYGNKVVSEKAEEVAKLLRTVWDTLSLDSKHRLLLALRSEGNAATMTIMGEIALRFLDDVEKQVPNPDLRLSYFSAAFTLFHNAIMNLGVGGELRTELVQRAFVTFRRNSPYSTAFRSSIPIWFIVDNLIAGDGIMIDASTYEGDIREFVSVALSHEPVDSIHLSSFLFVFKHLQDYVSPEGWEATEAYIEYVLAGYNGSARTTHFLLWAVTSPIDPELRDQIEQLIGDQHFDRWSLDDLKALTRFDDPVAMQFSDPALESEFFDEIVHGLEARFDERPPVDSHYPFYDDVLTQTVRLMKSRPSVATRIGRLVPLLHRFNPQHDGESAGEYQLRLAKVEGLWMRDRVFLVDLSGGLCHGPLAVDVGPSDYSDIVSDFERNHPGWLDVVILATSGGFSGYVGVTSFEWSSGEPGIDTPYGVMRKLLHEGGHSLHLKHEPESRALDVYLRYWFREYDRVSSHFMAPDNFPSHYAGTNAHEYFAEFTRFFHLDSRKWVELALEKFREGHPAMLNMFLFIGNMKQPSDAPAGDFMAFFRVDEATGLLDREYLEAWWEEGRARDGIFKLRLDEKLYSVVYRDHRISTFEVAEVPCDEAGDDCDGNGISDECEIFAGAQDANGDGRPDLCEAGQLPGDCNQDGAVDISDAICVLGFLFIGSPQRLPCGEGSSRDSSNVELIDWQGDKEIDIADGIALLRFLFGEGPSHALRLNCTAIPGCPDECLP